LTIHLLINVDKFQKHIQNNTVDWTLFRYRKCENLNFPTDALKELTEPTFRAFIWVSQEAQDCLNIESQRLWRVFH
jgi:hypothetical protein